MLVCSQVMGAYHTSSHIFILFIFVIMYGVCVIMREIVRPQCR